MVGIGYELGSVKNSFFGLRPELLTSEGREDFWMKLHNLAIVPGFQAVVLHRMFGEPSNLDWMDYDTRRQIESCNDSKYTDYAKHMTRELVRFANSFPQIRIDLYFGSLRQFNMAFLVSQGASQAMQQEWMRRFWYENETARSLIDQGCNVRMVFDHSSSFNPYRPERQALYQLDRMYPRRVVIESLPKVGTPQEQYPAWTFEDHYQSLLDLDPARTQHKAITRMTHGDPEGGVVGFVRDCIEHGHDAIISDTVLRRSKKSYESVLREAKFQLPLEVE